MMLRNLVHHPVRATFTVIGTSATAILIVDVRLRYDGSLVDVTYFMADRACDGELQESAQVTSHCRVHVFPV
jgi:hypothetical protein